jgi:hypothetical protein
MNKRNKFIMCVCGFLTSLNLAGANKPLPTIMEIENLSSPTNPPKVLFENVYPLLTNLNYYTSSYPKTEVNPIYYHLMTNILSRVAETNISCETEFKTRASLFEWVAVFPYVGTDSAAVLYCADYIGNLTSIATNAYRSEMIVANKADYALDPEHGKRKKPGLFVYGKNFGPNRKQFEKKWNPILLYNSALKNHRKNIIQVFERVVLRFKEASGDEAFEAIKPQIIQRAKLTPEEANEVFLRTQEK